MHIKKVTALVIALSMVFALASCAKQQTGDAYGNVGITTGGAPTGGSSGGSQTSVPDPVQPEEPAENLRSNGSSYLEYQVIVPGEGVGDHPSYMALTQAKETLASIGITLEIVDPEDSVYLNESLAAGSHDIWAAAWPTNVEPDLYPYYHSGSIEGGSNYFHLSDAALDANLDRARSTDDQAQRRLIYGSCIETVMSHAVEIPAYQRLSAVVFSSTSVQPDSITKDMTMYWGWEREAERIAMTDEDGVFTVATGPLSGQFSPWYAITANDRQIVELTTLSTLTTDRQGAIVFNAIEGETRSYKGTDYLYTGPADITVEYDEASDTATYTIRLREDIHFAHGGMADADDLIFACYVFADPSYDGPVDLAAFNIQGLEDYRIQATPEIYSRYNAMFQPIYDAGPDAVYTDSMAEAASVLWQTQEQVWQDSISGTVDFVYNNYIQFAEDPRYGGGFTPEKIGAVGGLRVAYAMAVWGYGTWDGSGKLTSASGRVWNCAEGEYPTVADFYGETYLAYEGDIAAYAAVEDAYGSDLLTLMRRSFVKTMAASEPDTAGGVPYITGIRRVDDYTVQIVTDGYTASAVYTLCDLPIVDMEYYSAAADDYDYEGSSFGVVYGDLDATFNDGVLMRPSGSGAYSLSDYDSSGVVTLKANEDHLFGSPVTQTVCVVSMSSAQVAAAIAEGTVDCGQIAGSRQSFEAICGYNGNGQLSGNAITTYAVDHYVYGYIGMNADTVCVNGDPNGDQSVALRRALATVIALYREESTAAYYGESAQTVHYPLAGASWAAPQPYEDDFAEAYTTDINGDPIYTDDMTFEEKEAAAVAACLEYLEAAGFTIVGGVVTAGPPAAPAAE